MAGISLGLSAAIVVFGSLVPLYLQGLTRTGLPEQLTGGVRCIEQTITKTWNSFTSLLIRLALSLAQQGKGVAELLISLLTDGLNSKLGIIGKSLSLSQLRWLKIGPQEPTAAFPLIEQRGSSSNQEESLSASTPNSTPGVETETRRVRLDNRDYLVDIFADQDSSKASSSTVSIKNRMGREGFALDVTQEVTRMKKAVGEGKQFYVHGTNGAALGNILQSGVLPGEELKERGWVALSGESGGTTELNRRFVSAINLSYHTDNEQGQKEGHIENAIRYAYAAVARGVTLETIDKEISELKKTVHILGNADYEKGSLCEMYHKAFEERLEDLYQLKETFTQLAKTEQGKLRLAEITHFSKIPIVIVGEGVGKTTLVHSGIEGEEGIEKIKPTIVATEEKYLDDVYKIIKRVEVTDIKMATMSEIKQLQKEFLNDEASSNASSPATAMCEVSLRTEKVSSLAASPIMGQPLNTSVSAVFRGYINKVKKFIFTVIATGLLLVTIVTITSLLVPQRAKATIVVISKHKIVRLPNGKVIVDGFSSRDNFKTIAAIMEILRVTDPYKTDEDLECLVKLLLSVAAHESGYFRYDVQLKGGPARSYFQLEPWSALDVMIYYYERLRGYFDILGIEFDEMQVLGIIAKEYNEKIYPASLKLPSKRKQFMYRKDYLKKQAAFLGIGERLKHDIKFGALVARLYFSRITPKYRIPNTPDKMARLWKRYYNTLSGKGTIKEFIKKFSYVKKYIESYNVIAYKSDNRYPFPLFRSSSKLPDYVAQLSQLFLDKLDIRAIDK
ncbi:MAG: hypothetical protein DRP76_05085, partial [Candidatus Omnitrophota bacterium]